MKRASRRQIRSEITAVAYSPPRPHALDIEIFPIAVLHNRVSRDFLRLTERVYFHLLIFVTRGSCTHFVDFQSIKCTKGSVIIINPGEVHRFDPDSDWDGWLVMFKPEFLESGQVPMHSQHLNDLCRPEGLPSHLVVDNKDLSLVVETITTMFHDSRSTITKEENHVLLRSQLNTIFVRLHLAIDGVKNSASSKPAAVRAFTRYRIALEENFRTQHSVLFYARTLGCSAKSLTTSVQQCTGMGAKEFLSNRLILEAKRLLIHTSMPVNAIAENLGFDEVTNFVKFFRRESGFAPGIFRSKHQAASIVS